MKNIQQAGYYRFPTIYNDKIAFVAEDDLWIVAANGGTARRLTNNLGHITHPLFSPDGKWIAFNSTEEGQPEVFIIATEGGTVHRLTYLGALSCKVVAWKDDNVIFASNKGQAFWRVCKLHSVGITADEPKELPYGVAHNVGFGKKGVVLGRSTAEPARWKRYRGGTVGQLWIDEKGEGKFYKLVGDSEAKLPLNGNLASPLWIGKRIYFISDHEGIGNIYSCTTKGNSLKKHTNHTEYYVRNLRTDGKHIVYHAGADIYKYNVANGRVGKVHIDYFAPKVQLNRKFTNASNYLESFDLNSEGSRLAVISRGKSFTFGNWEGPISQQGERNGSVRYRLSRWLNDGKRLVMASDEGGVDHLQIQHIDGNGIPVKIINDVIGRPYDIKVSPKKDEILFSNHRHELYYINLESKKITLIDRSEFSPLSGFNWSPCGHWVAYSTSINRRITVIKIFNIETGEKQQVTDAILNDVQPVFDPTGKYLYFLSSRVFNPVYDAMHFDLNFPKGMKPYLITLQKSTLSPLVLQARAFRFDFDERGKPPKLEVDEIPIDFDGIQQRIIALPVAEGKYRQIIAIKDKVLYTTLPVEGAMSDPKKLNSTTIKAFDLITLEESVFATNVNHFKLSQDNSSLVYQSGKRLRVVRAYREKEDKLLKDNKINRKSGWIDLSRIKLSVHPEAEWAQMFHEAWRLQRDFYWIETMSGIDWQKILNRYEPLVERVASRSEFSDLVWEMQGELGTSHAYEIGGDYRPNARYNVGVLGASVEYDKKHDAYRFTNIVKGDVWGDKNTAPLKRLGVNVTEGMLLLKVNGQRVNGQHTPNERLVNLAGTEVEVTVAESDGSSPRNIIVRTLGNDMPLRYRDWVEKNRAYVHEQSNGRLGYVHVPNMGPWGYAEFHRYFLTELDNDGLVVDVRFNGGGHVSQLLIEKLARRRLSFRPTRWMGESVYPTESIAGAVIAVTNENAGSDGDIFSHVFKMMKLGKLIGKRTWGGVIGIWPRNYLVDGTVTTQPEFSSWFKDVGWNVENYGTDPDIEVDIKPQDYVDGKDPQLDRAIEEILKELEENPPFKPDYNNKPDLTLP